MTGRGTHAESLISLSQHGSAEERRGAIADLEEMGARESVPALLELLDFPDAGVRANVAQALGQLGGDEVGAALVALLADPDALVRLKAAESLGELRYAPGRDALTDALAAESDPLVRIHVVEALGAFQDHGALPALLGALADADEYVRGYAADAIGRLGSRDAVGVLKARLASEQSAFAKAYLLATLYRFGDEGSLRALVELTDGADDILAATILNVAVELATADNAPELKRLIAPVAQSRRSLVPEVSSLLTRLDAISPARNGGGTPPSP